MRVYPLFSSVSLIYVILTISILGAFPATVRIGEVSLAALLVLMIVFYAGFVFAVKPVINKRHQIILLLLTLFVFYDVVARYWAPINLRTIYNMIVWIGILVIFASTVRVNVYVDSVLRDINKYIEFLSFLFIPLLLFFGVIGSQDPASTQVGLLFFSYYLSRYVNGETKAIYFILLIILAHILTLNRIIFVTELMLLVFANTLLGTREVRNNDKGRFFWFLARVVVVALIGVFALSNTGINEAFTEGDNAVVVGEVNINTSGRAVQWEVIYESASENFWFGKGIDVPPEFSLLGSWEHPHNDYLRLFHRLGLLGLILWLSFYMTLLFTLRRLISRAQSGLQRQWIQMSLAYSIGLSLFMVTDNTLVYSYVMFPFATLAGVALSLGVVKCKY